MMQQDDPGRRATPDGETKSLAACRVEDFDGHTTFAQLSPKQRLDWADRAARMVLQLQGLAKATLGDHPREQRSP